MGAGLRKPGSRLQKLAEAKQHETGETREHVSTGVEGTGGRGLTAPEDTVNVMHGGP